MKTNKFKSLFATALVGVATWFSSCNSDINVGLPQGPEGDRGYSAYQVWKNSVEDGTIAWPKSEVTIVDFFKFLKGADGANGLDGVNGLNGLNAYEEWKKYISTGQVDHPLIPGQKWGAGQNTLADFWLFLTGASGQNGQTPVIGDNGNWWIGNVDTGKPARGEKGEMAQAPEVYIGANGNWIINGVDTNVPATGKDGVDGRDGVAPKLTIAPNGNWAINGVDTGMPSRGAQGAAGVNGIASDVKVGPNGNWFIDGVDTGKPSQGQNGGSNEVSISDAGTWIIGGVDTGKPVKGIDGTSPIVTIGDNGNWHIYGIDTNQPSRGPKGNSIPAVIPTVESDPATGNWIINSERTTFRARAKDGTSPAIGISPNGYWVIGGQETTHYALGLDGKTPVLEVRDGYWYINGERTSWPSQGGNARTVELTISPTTGNWVLDGNDTGMPARGPQGDAGSNGPNGPNGPNGQNGLSAYELWKAEIAKGLTPNPHEDGIAWDPSKNTITDFWQFLRGKDGVNGADGAAGADGKPGVAVELNKYNVLATYYNASKKEYVTPIDGSVTYIVYDKTGNPVGAGVKITGMPGMDPTKEFVTDANGQFKLPRTDLPTGVGAKGAVNVTDGSNPTEQSAANTLVPAQVETRLISELVFINDVGIGSLHTTAPSYYRVIVSYKLERNINGVWSEYPDTYPMPTYKAVQVINPDLPLTAANVIDNATTNLVGIVNNSYTALRKYFGFIRPGVLMTEEANGTAPAVLNGYTQVKATYDSYNGQFKYTGTPWYYTMKGLTNDYGTGVLLDAAVHVPEIYAAPPMEDLHYSVTMSESQLWGKVDPAKFAPFYSKMVRSQSGSVVKWTSTRRPGSDLIGMMSQTTVKLLVYATADKYGTPGSTSIMRNMRTHQDPADGRVKFALSNAYENNYYYSYVYFDDRKGQNTQGRDDRILKDVYGVYRPTNHGILRGTGPYLWEDPYLKTSTTIPTAPVPDATWYQQ